MKSYMFSKSANIPLFVTFISSFYTEVVINMQKPKQDKLQVLKTSEHICTKVINW
jgi:hypothetical protein